MSGSRSTTRARATAIRRRTPTELAAIDAAIYDYLRAEHPATVRNVFYVLTTKPVAIEKTQLDYRVVCRRCLEMRRAGDPPYVWVVDGSRHAIRWRGYASAEAAVEEAAYGYRRAIWADSSTYVELWVESDSVAGEVKQVAYEWDVPLLAAHGFSSETFLFETGRVLAEIAEGRTVQIVYIGDHDPSGVLIPEKILEQLHVFAPGVEIVFSRLAVTAAQIEEWNLPGKPPKQGDTRTRNFHGEAVDVEAIPAAQLREMLGDRFAEFMPRAELRRLRDLERRERATLIELAESGELQRMIESRKRRTRRRIDG